MKDQPANTSDEQLAAMTRGSKTYTIAGRSLTILQMNITQLGVVARGIKPIVESLGTGITDRDLPRLVAEFTDPVIDIVTAASGQDRVWVATLPVDQFLLLAQAVWEVDHAFFVQYVSPVAESLAKQLFGDGLTFASASTRQASANLLS